MTAFTDTLKKKILGGIKSTVGQTIQLGGMGKPSTKRLPKICIEDPYFSKSEPMSKSFSKACMFSKFKLIHFWLCLEKIYYYQTIACF